MWAYVSTARVEVWANRWFAAVTLQDGEKTESAFLMFPTEPTAPQIATKGAALAAIWNDEAADKELESFLSTASFSPLQYQTAAELAARFRRKFLTSSKDVACAMAYWLVERVIAGNFTQAQVRNAFGFTVAEYTAFSNRMQALHDHWAAVIAAAGE